MKRKYKIMMWAACIVVSFTAIGYAATSIYKEQQRRHSRLVHLLKVLRVIPPQVEKSLQKDVALQSRAPGFKRDAMYMEKMERYLRQLSMEDLLEYGTPRVTALRLTTKEGKDALLICNGEQTLLAVLRGEIHHAQFLFRATQDDGRNIYAVAVAGPGYWGPIHGYLALRPGLQEIAGVSFYQHSESVGLGKRMEEGWFQVQFAYWRKRLWNQDASVLAVKLTPRTGAFEGDAGRKADNEVDAITAATETSRSLEKLLPLCVEAVLRCLQKHIDGPEIQQFLDRDALESLRKKRLGQSEKSAENRP